MRISFFLQGPEIRTGFLKDAKPIQLKEGQEITISTDYEMKGDSNTITMSYKKLAEDLKPGNTILCADGTITLTVLSTDKVVGTVRCRCENTYVAENFWLTFLLVHCFLEPLHSKFDYGKKAAYMYDPMVSPCPGFM